MLEERKILVDTNILIYFFDKKDEYKNEQSKKILKTIFEAGIGVISIQNLAEFSSNAYRKKFIDSSKLNTIILDFMDVLKVVRYDEDEILRANTISQQYGIHFFDALIVAMMQKEKITRILTENEADFKKIDWIEPVNPFTHKEKD